VFLACLMDHPDHLGEPPSPPESRAPADLPAELLSRWQGSADLAASFLGVRAVLITRARGNAVQVLVASHPPGCPHKPGDVINMDGRHFCEDVFHSGRELVIRDARREPRWASGACVRQGTISYHGVPLFSPDGGIFGSLCSLDDKENQGGEAALDMIRRLGERIQTDLRLWRDLERSRREAAVIRRDRDLTSAILDTADALVVVLDTQGRIVRFNRACERATLYRSNEVIGRYLWDVFLLPEELDSVKAVFASLRSGNFPNKHENYWLTRNGGRRLIAWSNTALVDAEGAVEYVIATGIDITEERKALQEREKHQERLHQLQRMEAISRLSAGVAHDFNNLLTIILSCSDRLQKTPNMDASVRKGLLGSIDQAARQASSVTRSLLSLSRGAETQKRHVVLSELIGESKALLRSSLPKSVELRINTDNSPSLVVAADRTQLQQVLINLAINAGDAMPDGGVLTISLSSAVATGGDSNETGQTEAVITVRDTGTAMTPEVKARAFEPFFTTKGHGRGTGLGLAIVDSIVKTHGGRIRLDSHPGQGTTFEIVLPCILAGPGGADEDTASPSPGRHECLLLLESCPQLRGIMRRTLRQAGYRVIPVPSRAEAEARLSQGWPAVRLLVVDSTQAADVGLAWIADLRAAGLSLPVVLIDGGEAADSQREDDPATTFLSKPFYPDDLVKVVRRILKGHEVKQEVIP